MRDVDDGDVSLFQLGEQLKQMLAFAHRERAGRFVHDNHLSFGAEGGGDLDKLLLPG